MNIDRLRYFIEISQSKSLSEAAQRLFVSQQGLTKAVADMEQELGIQLLVRAYDGVHVTPAGERFALCARQMVEAYDDMLMDIRGSSSVSIENDLKDVKISVTPYVLEALMNSLDMSYPGPVYEQSLKTISAQMSKPSCTDIALIDVFTREENHGKAEYLGFPSDDYCIDTLFCTKIGVAFPREHELAERTRVSIAEVSDLPLAVIDDETLATVTEAIFGGSGLPNVIQKASNVQLFIDQVQKRRSPGLLDSFAYWLMVNKRQLSSDITFAPLVTDFVGVVCFLYRRNSPLAATYAAFGKYLKRVFYKQNSEYFKNLSFSHVRATEKQLEF